MAAAEFDTPELKEYPVIPHLQKDVMKHSQPFVAKAEFHDGLDDGCITDHQVKRLLVQQLQGGFSIIGDLVLIALYLDHDRDVSLGLDIVINNQDLGVRDRHNTRNGINSVRSVRVRTLVYPPLKHINGG